MATKAAERVAELAKEIGQHCEETVGVIDKIMLPYTSRDMRNRWVEKKLLAYEAATIERCAQIAETFAHPEAKSDASFGKKLAAAIRSMGDAK